MSEKSYGQIGYEAFADSNAWKTEFGHTMPTWDALLESIKEAWEIAARAILEAEGPV